MHDTVVLDLADAPTVRIRDAALRCMARWGVAKTTLDDVAREAGVSRATVYRAVPGGRDALLAALARSELDALATSVRARVEASADLGEALAGAMHEAGSWAATHPVLRFALRYEPELVLPHVAFAGCERVLDRITAEVAPAFERFLAPAEARAAVDWAARALLSYAVTPADHVDLCDPASVAELVRRHVLPAAAAERLERV